MLGLIIAIAAIVVAALILLAVVTRRRYRSRVREWASSRGWVYGWGGGGDWTAFLPRGDRRLGVKLQLDGNWQRRPASVADYWYETESTDSDGSTSTSRHHLTVVVVYLAGRYPDLVLRPRMLGKLGLNISKAVGRSQANLTGILEFDKSYRIAPGSDGATGVLNPPLIQVTLEQNLPAWQLRGNLLVIPWKGSVRVSDLDSRLGQAVTLADVIDPVRW
jgi:hypothetical protein